MSLLSDDLRTPVSSVSKVLHKRFLCLGLCLVFIAFVYFRVGRFRVAFFFASYLSVAMLFIHVRVIFQKLIRYVYLFFLVELGNARVVKRNLPSGEKSI